MIGDGETRKENSHGESRKKCGATKQVVEKVLPCSKSFRIFIILKPEDKIHGNNLQ
jgi:hypothetical protein